MVRHALIVILALLASHAVARGDISIVAAENVYGDVARQVAGPDAKVSSVLSNPDQDPHLFEASASVARLLSGAAIVVYNGAGYDPWMTKLLGATLAAGRSVIVVADLVHWREGGNPHLWYDPPTMPTFARALAAELAQRDPEHRGDYATRLASFLGSLDPLAARIASLRQRLEGAPVTATEPVFGLMAAALGLSIRNERLQVAVMNNAEPRASDVAAFETDLRSHAVRLLLFNSQATSAAAQRLVRIARQSGVPVVGVTETLPAGQSYQAWMAAELDAVDRALAP
ncbi:MAG TPA: zinc ABC transporter substrate-binding protein [Acetobacteraceae bacterium]|nr:zinc ABC transporter substrate-binding protein [Acetobacteraceae bacterium]